MPCAVIDKLLAVVSECGYGKQPFTEAAFNSKKLYPGFQFRHASPGWPVLTVTVESLDTMIKAELGEWNRTPGRYRTRPSCQQLENNSEMEAFVMWLVDQTVAKSHASKADLDEVLVKNYIGGESKLIMELNAAMQEKPRDMHPKRISCLAALTTTSTPQTIVKASTADMQRMVDEDHFLLHLRSVEVAIKTTVLHSQMLVRGMLQCIGRRRSGHKSNMPERRMRWS